MGELDLAAYLARIGLAKAEVTPDLESLTRLLRGQASNIHYEQLAIAMGERIELDLESLQNKMVKQQRGGYCFELNHLFLAALIAVGFKVRPLLVRVRFGRASREEMGRTHMTLLVTLPEGVFIADVGCGAPGPWSPLLLKHGTEVTHDSVTHRVTWTEDPEPMWIMSVLWNGNWCDFMEFNEGLAYPIDFEMANTFTAVHRLSRMTHGNIVQRIGEKERRTLFNNTMRVYLGGRSQGDIHVADDEVVAVLREYFDIVVPADTVFRPPFPPLS